MSRPSGCSESLESAAQLHYSHNIYIGGAGAGCRHTQESFLQCNDVILSITSRRRNYCEAQARVRQGSARDGSQGKMPQSLNPSLELKLKLVATTTTTTPQHPEVSFHPLMARQRPGEASGGKGRCVGSLWDTLGSL